MLFRSECIKHGGHTDRGRPGRLSLPLETAFRIQGPEGSPNGGMTPNPLSENGTRSRLQTSVCVPINRTPQVTVTPARPGSCSPLHLPTSGGPRGQKTPGLDVLTPPHKLLGSACELPSPLPSLGPHPQIGRASCRERVSSPV